MALPSLIDVETFFADPEFFGATVSPDGTRLAYLAPQHGRTQVWIRGLDEEHADAVCVTHDERRGIKTYYWTDDPRWLLYLQDTDGNEDWHLYRVDLDALDAPAVDLTPMAPFSRVMAVESLASSPGCVRVTMNLRPAFIDPFKVEIATGETTVIRENNELTGGYLFGPNDEVLYMLQGQDGFWEFSTVDEAGERRVFYRDGGTAFPVGVHPTIVTPDGTGLLVGAYGDGDDLQLVRVDIASGETSVVAAIEGHSLDTSDVAALVPTPGVWTRRVTGEILAARFVGDRPIVKVLDPEFAEVYAALSELSEGVLATVSSDEKERYWVATFTHDRAPGLTYLYDHATGESRLLFRPYPQLDPATLAPMTPVSFTARDGLPLHAFLTLPVGLEPTNLPLVLHVHGGPWLNDQWGYDRETQFFANRGYAVLQVNMRGSSGYGKRHLISAVRELSGKMHDDLIDAVNWAVEQGYADPQRLGIYGGSYGGYATLVAVSFTPDVFAAAVDYCGISNLANFMRTLPSFVKPLLLSNWYGYVGDPEDPADEADMMARSPITKIEQIRTPLLVVQGSNDPRVVKEESDNVVELLRARGVEVDYLVAEDEGHGFENPENLIRMFHAIDRHFANHLGGRAGAGASA